MLATLYLVPNADAAFEHAAAQLRSLRAVGPVAPAYLLLPGAAAVAEVRDRLHDSAGVNLLEFYRLGRLILDRAGEPVYRISGAASRRLVSRLLEEAQAGGELTSFAAVWDRPGFTQVLMEWLREMKAQNIRPEQVSAQAEASGSERDRQLGLLYGRYQAFLAARGCVDAEGLLWLAAEALERNPRLLGNGAFPGLFLALGFDHFTPVQVRILGAVAGQVERLGIYLPWDEERTPDSLALTRLRDTRAALEAALLPVVEAAAEAEGEQAPALAGLRRCMFETGAEAVRDGGPAGTAAAIAAVAAPSREAEVRRALAGAKSLLLQGVRPERIALACPTLDTYARIVQAVGEEYGVPVAVQQPLALNPAIAALSDVLGLAPDYPWRATLDALRSPYLRQPWLTAEQVGQLDRLTRERPVLAGREQWRYALQPLDRPGEGEDEDLGAPPLAATLAQEELAEIRDGLSAFFDHVTPSTPATHHDYALWLQEAILGLRDGNEEGEPRPGERADWKSAPDTLNATDRIAADQTIDAAGLSTDGLSPEAERSGTTEPEALGEAATTHGTDAAASLDMLARTGEGSYAERDRAALAAFMNALRELVDAAALVPPQGDGRVSWPAFRNELVQELAGRTLPAARGEAAVPFLPLVGVRTRPVDHLFVLGLAEGEFPSPPQPDVFYTTAEREPGGYALPLSRVEPGEDASLWWQALGNCRRSLTLLRPRFDESGAEWLPSPYWDYVITCVDGLAGRVEKPRIADVPQAAEAAGPAELLVALALANGSPTGASEGASQGAIENAVRDGLTGLPTAWASAQRASQVMAERAGRGACGTYEGVLRDPGLQGMLARRYGPDHSWSASRLNRYGICPYSFFAGAALALEPLADPEEGLNVMQRGSVIHRILELLYRGLADTGLVPEPATEQEVLRRLDESCGRVFATAPAAYGFRPGPLWRYEQDELKRLLAALVRWECSREDAGRFRPWQQELRFGVRGAQIPPVLIVGPDGRGCLVHGVIDRIDRDESGRLRVIDYKSGSRKYSKDDVTAGRALQTALYALAAGQALPEEPAIAESYYLHVPSREPSGKLSFSGPAGEDEMALRAAGQAAAFAARAAAGQFPAGPSKPMPGRQACAYTCDFAALCAPTRGSIAKARRHIQETGYNGAD